MFKNLLFIAILLPLGCLAQLTISGKVLNQAGKKPIANASVFLSNASVGDKTNDDGTFTLHNVKPGKYELVVSIVGFETYRLTVDVNNSNLTLPPIEISAKAIALAEVSIKPKNDPYKARNYEWFKNEFLGTSYLAKDCTILNPDVLDMDYDNATKVLTASSYDFLDIQNDALGYRVKYLLANFTMDNKDELARKVHYTGSVAFEYMKGTPAQERRWQNRRQEVYLGSEMHFLRSVLDNRAQQEGFRVLQLATFHKPGASNPQKTVQKLLGFQLNKADMVEPTAQTGIYALGCSGDALHITYSKNNHFPRGRINDLDLATNTDQTVLNFSAQVLLDRNGGVITPDNISFGGAWGRNRVAELLPVDYEVPAAADKKDMAAPDYIADKLKSFLDEHVAEKAYLHFDKPYYAAGDTMYFKAYVTLGEEHQLSGLSNILHVEFINTKNKIDQSVKLQLADGVAWGDFALPDSLPKGDYRVRAYTQWMRNDGNYFEQNIPVGAIHNDKVPESGTRNTPAISARPDLQFFPEGGDLVTGVRAKIAFKAVAGNGLGINVKGILTDEENRQVASFASAHLGMGSFYFTPQQGKTYQAQLVYADGSKGVIDLPKTKDDGIVLSIDNDSIPKASVRIEASKAWYEANKHKNYSLFILSGGVITTINCPLDSTVITLDILKRRLHTGIATVTLFSPDREPLCERLLFIQNYDQLNLALSSDKAVYAKRGRVDINLNAKNRAGDPAGGHFSVSVINENTVPADENSTNTILSNLLLTSDLRGQIEQPNYYFNNISAQTLSNLDLVMLTHGYRRFEWKQVLAGDQQPLAYQPEKSLEITGTAKNLFGAPIVNGTVSLITKHDGTYISATTGSKGYFKFDGLEFTDSTKFILQATDAKGGINTKLIYNNELPPSVTASGLLKLGDTSKAMATYLENDWKHHQEIVNYGEVKGRILKTVIIKDRRIDNTPISSSYLVTPEFADQYIKADQLAKGGPLSDRLSGAAHGVVIHHATGHSFAYLGGSDVRMRVILDGQDTDGNLDAIDGDLIESVEVLKYVGTVGAYSGFAGSTGINRDGTQGILVLNTKKNLGMQAKDMISVGFLAISPQGYYKAREFYSPKYSSTTLASNRPDLRSTIYWKPELVTDKDGNAAFTYYNADGPGTYRVVIEGIDDKGNLGRQVYRYNVE